MASKRQLKKSINNLTYELVSECFTYRNFHPEHNSGINDIIQSIVKTRNDLITRLNHVPTEKKEQAAHLNSIAKEMNGMVNNLDKIESLKQ